MGRKARHSARTGDGGAELRQRKKELAGAQRAQKDAELAFYDDPSEGESDAEQAGVSSDEDELEGEEVMDLGEGDEEEEEEEEEEEDVVDEGDDDGFDADAERKRARQMEAQWGKSRKNFYSADTAHYEIDSDEEAAKDEEEAALELQRKQAALLDDEDFGFDEDAAEDADEDEEGDEQPESNKPVVDDEALVGEQLADIANLADDGAGGATSVEQVHKDFSKMSKKDKLQIVNQSAPELLGLMSELEATTTELQEVVTPALLKLRPVRRKSRALQLGLRYLTTRQNLLLNYSANISFYLLLRAEGKSVADHPVLLHLLLLKKQLNKMQALDEVLDEQLQELLTKEIPEPEERQRLDDGLDQFFSKKDKAGKATGKRGAAASSAPSKKAKRKQTASSVSTAEQAEAQQFYETMAREQAALKQSKKELYTHETPALAASSGEDDSDAEGAAGKRGASYQIIKNKGLKAHKSKLNRNPRVKKRMQFRKAVIRRKGQVRDVRTGEAGKYGGETTGIKSNLSRSRKIRN